VKVGQSRSACRGPREGFDSQGVHARKQIEYKDEDDQSPITTVFPITDISQRLSVINFFTSIELGRAGDSLSTIRPWEHLRLFRDNVTFRSPLNAYPHLSLSPLCS